MAVFLLEIQTDDTVFGKARLAANTPRDATSNKLESQVARILARTIVTVLAGIPTSTGTLLDDDGKTSTGHWWVRWSNEEE